MRVGRHRHSTTVRADGLATVLGSLARDPALVAALLVDLDSGMVLDACGLPEPPPGTKDLGTGRLGAGDLGTGRLGAGDLGTGRLGAGVLDTEELGAAHGELMRLALGAATGVGATGEEHGRDHEVVVSVDGHRHLVLRRVPDPHADRLVLSVLLDGAARAVRRVRRRLGEVSTSALTAGPSLRLRPGLGAWGDPDPTPAPRVPAEHDQRPAGEPHPARRPDEYDHRPPAPPAALPPSARQPTPTFRPGWTAARPAPPW